MKISYFAFFFLSLSLPLHADWKVGDWINGNLGEFRIEEEIGIGGTGKVFKASPLRLGPSIAIRQIIPNERFDEKSGVKLLERARRIKRLQSEDRSPDVRFLQRVLDVGEYELLNPRPNEPKRAILTELLNPQTAEDHPTRIYQAWMDSWVPDPSNSSKFKVEDIDHSVAMAYFVNRHLLNALAVLARHGLIHNDIKPRNILFRTPKRVPVTVELLESGEAEAVLCDFDGILPLGEMTLIRTAGFSAPEREQHPHYPNLVSDLYGLGQTTDEMLFHTVTSRPWCMNPAENFAGILKRSDLPPRTRNRAQYLSHFSAAMDKNVTARIEKLNEVGKGMFTVSSEKGIVITSPEHLPAYCHQTLSDAH